MFSSIRRIVDGSDTRGARAFDLVIQALIVVSLVSFCIETLPDLSQNARRWLFAIEVATVAVFSAEYALRLTVAEKKLRFIFSFYGLIDLAAILPFYLSTGIDLRSIRVVRMLRLFRIFKLLRYGKAIERFKAAFLDIKEELVVFLIVAVLAIFIASVGIYYFESEAQPKQFGSVFHCMWWAVVTLTTVGYGDVYPITVGGKIFTGAILITGLGVIAVPSGLFAAALTRNDRK